MSKTLQNTGKIMRLPESDRLPEVMRRIRTEIHSLPDSQVKKDMERAWSKAVLVLASEYPDSF